MDNKTKKQIVAVVTRYNESIDWIRYIINKVDKIYIYNKGENKNFFKFFDTSDIDPEGVPYTNKLVIKQLPNIGRIDHTLAYHIIEDWDSLPDIIINIPGSIMMCPVKGQYLSMIMKSIPILQSKYSGFYGPRFRKTDNRFNYTIDNYQAEGVCNRNDNPFIKSEYADFKAWKTAIIDNLPMRYVAMRGMFSVCKENIRHIDKQIYINLRESLSVGDNIENGHFAERIWAHLFRQYGFISQQSDK